MSKGAKSVFLTTLLLLVLAPSVIAQEATQLRVDGEKTKSYIAYLSTDEFMGRQTLTPQYQAAAEWVAAQYEAWGLEPAGDDGTYFHRVPIQRGLTWNEGIPELSVNGMPFSVGEGDFSPHSASTAATSVAGEVVFVGYGISAPAKGLDEYAGVDLQGKVALVLMGSPKDAPAIGGGGGFSPAARDEPEPEEAWEAESTVVAKIRTAYDNGAAAVLLYNPDSDDQAAVRFRRPGDQREVFEPARDFLAFTVTDRAFRAIMKPDFQETVRGFSHRLNLMRDAIKYGTPRSVATDASVELKGYDTITEYSEELGNNFAYNVVAKLPGTDPDLKDEFVVMGGHLDHVGVRNGQIRNGADDNASGTAVAMEVARVLKEGGFQPKRTIVFTAWTGEEMGLIGSYYFVSNPPEGIDIDKVVTYFNMDMVGLGDAIGAPGALNFPTIWDVIKRDQDADVMAAIRPRTGGPGGSDHSGFITLGIEALALMTSGGQGHPYYHQPEDDTKYIEPEILRKTGQFVLQGTVNLANEEDVELLIPNRQELYNALMLSVNSFNPGLSDYESVSIPAEDKESLMAIALDSAQAVAARLREAEPLSEQERMMMMYYGVSPDQGGKSFQRGTGDLAAFEGDLQLLLNAAEFIGFGRLDISGNDGHWFADGGLTAAGREAVGFFEENELWIHLESPSEAFLSKMLSLASKPFIVSGDYSLSVDMVEAINQKSVVLAVNLDPSNVDRAVSDLEALKLQLGDTDNLVLRVTTEELSDEAKRAFYMGLIDAGWEHTEIAGARRGGGGVTGNNLRVFSAPPSGMFR